MSIPFISPSHLFNRVNSCRSCSSGAMDHLCWLWRMVQCYWWTRSRWPMTRYWKDLTAFSNLKGRSFLPRKVVVHWTQGKMSIFLSLMTIFELLEQWILEGTSARRRYANNLHCFCFAFYPIGATKGIFPIILGDALKLPLSLSLKTSLRAHSLSWIPVFIPIEIRTNYHNKNFTLRLSLKERMRGNRKWPIRIHTLISWQFHFHYILISWVRYYAQKTRGFSILEDVVIAIKLEIKLSTAMCSYQSLVQIARSWSRYRDPFE